MTLLRFALAAAFQVALVSAAPADEHWVFLGTYTGKSDKDSKGIYRCKFDDATGKLTEPELAAEMGSPSFVNIQTLPHMMRGGLVADAVAVISSVDPVLGEVDR